MRHRKAFNHLGRKKAHREAMLSNMANSLILNKRITTTEAKAKALRSFVEPIITRSKEDTTHSRRIAFRYLRNKEAVSELFREISPKVMTREGGYTRILKIGNRQGDNAEMVMIELVDYNESMLAAKEEKKGRTRRRRGSGKKNTEEGATTAATAEVEVAQGAEEVQAEAAEETPAAEAEAATEEVKAEEAPIEEAKPEEASAEEVKAEAETEEKPEAKAEEEKKDDEGKEEEKKEE